MKEVLSSAPGSLMLFGEHAVLKGSSCLVGAINKRLYVRIKSSADHHTHVFSDQFSPRKFLQSQLSDQPEDYITLCLKEFSDSLPHPIHIRIRSEFKSTLGFGSSAALCAALLCSLRAYVDHTFELNEKTRLELFKQGLKIIRKLQNYGSGADLAASLWGGCCFFKTEPFSLEKLSLDLDLLAVYCGFKTPTKEVIAYVKRYEEAFPQRVKDLYVSIERTVLKAKDSLLNQDEVGLREAVLHSQQALRNLGVSHPIIEEIIVALKNTGNEAAKISGSGLGDCVICFNHNSQFQKPEGFESFDIKISPVGCDLNRANCQEGKER